MRYCVLLMVMLSGGCSEGFYPGYWGLEPSVLEPSEFNADSFEETGRWLGSVLMPEYRTRLLAASGNPMQMDEVRNWFASELAQYDGVVVRWEMRVFRMSSQNVEDWKIGGLYSRYTLSLESELLNSDSTILMTVSVPHVVLRSWTDMGRTEEDGRKFGILVPEYSQLKPGDPVLVTGTLRASGRMFRIEGATVTRVGLAPPE